LITAYEDFAREGVKISIRDLDELKQRLRTDWPIKLDHVVFAAAIRQWRRR